MKITIRPSPTADTRTCDWSKVSPGQLLASSVQHKDDIAQAIGVFQAMLTRAAVMHDFDKLTDIDNFHRDFATGFKQTGWWDRHRGLNRHHLQQEDGIPADVNLIDVLEFIADCVMAGMARSGSVYDLHLPDELLQRAFQNTVSLLKASVIVESPAQDETAAPGHTDLMVTPESLDAYLASNPPDEGERETRIWQGHPPVPCDGELGCEHVCRYPDQCHESGCDQPFMDHLPEPPPPPSEPGERRIGGKNIGQWRFLFYQRYKAKELGGVEALLAAALTPAPPEKEQK